MQIAKWKKLIWKDYMISTMWHSEKGLTIETIKKKNIYIYIYIVVIKS